MEIFPQRDSPPNFLLQKRVYQLVADGAEYCQPYHHTDAAKPLEKKDLPEVSPITKSVLFETPNPTILAEHKMVGIELFYLKADIVEGAEAEGALHDGGIQGQSLDGVALDEKAVTDMLEVSEHLALIGTPQKCQ